MVRRAATDRASGGQADSARAPAEGVQQAGERLGVADLSARDHPLEVRRGERANLFDELALVQPLLAPLEVGRDEEVDTLIVAAGHRVPLRDLLEPGRLVPRL